MIRASIETRKDGMGFWADLRIVNHGKHAATILNPGDYPPVAGWLFSAEAYRIAALRSMDFLEMTLTTAGGTLVEPSSDIMTLADHVVGLPLKLDPDAALTIPIPLHEFYQLERGATYRLTLTYGEPGTRIAADTKFIIS